MEGDEGKTDGKGEDKRGVVGREVEEGERRGWDV